MRRGGQQGAVVDGWGTHSNGQRSFALQFGGGAGAGRLGARVWGVQPMLARVVHPWLGAAVGFVGSGATGAFADADGHHTLLLPGQS